jgi:hypothetical protein
MTGWQLGSDPEIQVATNVTNHLTAATLKYFADSFRLGRAANLFEKMAEKEPEVAALLARAYIGMSKSYILFRLEGNISGDGKRRKLMLSQTKRSKRSKSCTPPSNNIPNPTPSYTLNAISYYQKENPNGPKKSPNKPSTALHLNL